MPEHVAVFVNEGDSHYRIPSLAVANDGTVLAFCNRRVGSASDDARADLVLRRSRDHGRTWLPMQNLGSCCVIGSAVVDTETGVAAVLYSRRPDDRTADGDHRSESDMGRFIAKSDDSGATWRHEELDISPNSLGKTGRCHGSGAGITLRFGAKRGRLLMPARFATEELYGHNAWSPEGIRLLQTHHFNCAIYSDDHGMTWKTGEPVQPGTGEGCLVERSDGAIYYNSRAYFFDGMRRSAISRDAGETFTDFAAEPALIEPNQGCNAALIRAARCSAFGRDAVLFANPANFPGRDTKWRPKMGRRNMTVRLSCDGGKTFGVSRTLNRGASGYSSLAVAGDGAILLLYEKGRETYNDTGLSLARFSPEWVVGARNKRARTRALPVTDSG